MITDDPTGVTTVRRDWVGEEDAEPGVAAELKRLARRARRRWLYTIGIALLGAALVVGMVARKPRAYVSKVAFRVFESELEAATKPHTNGNLRDYIATVVFSSSHLTAVIKEFDLYPSLMARDPSLAVESMRDDIDVEVWRSDFGAPRTLDDSARSARMSISFHSKNAVEAYDVVRALGKLVTESEQHSRMAQAEAALHMADDQVEQARNLLLTRKAALVEKMVARQKARTPELGLQLQLEQRDLEKAVPRAEKLLSSAEQKREQAFMRAQLEKHALGLRWELVDGGRVEPAGMSKKKLLAIIGTLVFLIALPVVGIGVGAFDQRVYDLEDVRRLGLPTVGAVRDFDGDNVGALEVRLAEERRSAPAGGRARITPS